MRRAMLHFFSLALAGIFLFGHPAFRLIRNLQEIDRLCHANDGDVTLLASSIRQWETGYLETLSRHLFSTCLSPSLDPFAFRAVAHFNCSGWTCWPRNNGSVPHRMIGC